MPNFIDGFVTVSYDEMVTDVGGLVADRGATSLSTTSVIAHNRATTRKKTASPSAWTAMTDSISEASRYSQRTAQAIRDWQEAMRAWPLRPAASTARQDEVLNNAASTPTSVSPGLFRERYRVPYPGRATFGSTWGTDGSAAPEPIATNEVGYTMSYDEAELRVIEDMALHGEFRATVEEDDTTPF